MKLDKKMIKSILFEIAEKSTSAEAIISLENYNNESVKYHLKTLIEAGLVKEVSWKRTFESPEFRPTDLTMDGHKLLQALNQSNIHKALKTLQPIVATTAAKALVDYLIQLS
ncbi:DUF2513 domain-containing protein [Spirulina sp. CCNP1310]|uniref:DUF2513 domain-containing protein n=1 Tax=Spirulina sp. CCNP1310 TaxID=3110249 RepID=UPI002B1ECD56|nr:DUF2513 domain-containing protein [Spirulina sp. CCNP1310]MEA5421504.1 DUF2513 domain-containing protein [Spirulina sp. CCNP1310]